MSKVQIRSIFEQISEIVFNTADLTTARQSTIAFVQSKSINDKDKQSILKAVNECKTITNFQMYVAYLTTTHISIYPFSRVLAQFFA